MIDCPCYIWGEYTCIWSDKVKFKNIAHENAAIFREVLTSYYSIDVLITNYLIVILSNFSQIWHRWKLKHTEANMRWKSKWNTICRWKFWKQQVKNSTWNNIDLNTHDIWYKLTHHLNIFSSLNAVPTIHLTRFKKGVKPLKLASTVTNLFRKQLRSQSRHFVRHIIIQNAKRK